MEGVDILKVTVQDECGKEDETSLSVLYGAGYPLQDDDNDGFADGPIADADCDDEDPWVYPYAAEIFDGKDNDCDGIIDEGTDGRDDDGDGHSEADGDCNDDDDEVFPDAPEQPDGKDTTATERSMIAPVCTTTTATASRRPTTTARTTTPRFTLLPSSTATASTTTTA